MAMSSNGSHSGELSWAAGAVMDKVSVLRVGNYYGTHGAVYLLSSSFICWVAHGAFVAMD